MRSVTLIFGAAAAIVMISAASATPASDRIQLAQAQDAGRQSGTTQRSSTGTRQGGTATTRPSQAGDAAGGGRATMRSETQMTSRRSVRGRSEGARVSVRGSRNRIGVRAAGRAYRRGGYVAAGYSAGAAGYGYADAVYGYRGPGYAYAAAGYGPGAAGYGYGAGGYGYRVEPAGPGRWCAVYPSGFRWCWTHYASGYSGLNPQPLPPRAQRAALNPQPLPPRAPPVNR
jgi:hypothetical protein